MKNPRTLITLGVALLAGVIAVGVASRWLVEKSAGETTRVAVATTDISLGQRLTPELLQLVDWPRSSTPPGAFNDIAALEGRVLRTNLLRGEPVLDAKLAPQGTKGGLSAVIGDGRRAITVRVNDVIGVAGFALPGNYVDIIVNTQRDGEQRNGIDKAISKIVLERILVLAVAQEVSRDETRPKVVNAVTLEVTPDQAEKLDLARSVGTLSLVLRNQVDPNPTATAGATKTTLLDSSGAQPMTVAAAAPASAAKSPRSRAAAKPARAAAVMPAAAPAAPAASLPSANCIAVINGVRNAQECY